MKTGRTETEGLQALVRSLVPNSTASLTNEEGEVRELTEEDFKGMRPLAETDPGMIEAVKQWRQELAHDRQHDLLTISIDLPKDDLKHIGEFASALGLTRSEFIVRATNREMLRSALPEAGFGDER
jgi:hypothetical protein